MYLNTPSTPPKQRLNAAPIPQKPLTMSLKVDECKPLDPGVGREAGAYTRPLFCST